MGLRRCVVKRIYWESPNASKTKDWPGEVQPGPSGLNAKKDFLKSRMKSRHKTLKTKGRNSKKKKSRWRFVIGDVIC